jgi:2-polyprenyl-3-methyl-5-hydroxy-6-metoxy-1,4-benzoquinol methylase
MLPSFPSAPPWYRYVLIGRWLFLKGIVAAGRAPVEPFAGAREMNETASPLTGGPIPERLVAQGGDGYLLADALSRYVWALPHLDGKRVVDLGCGTGYGAHVMSWVADGVTALDFSEEAVAYAREHYPGVDYRQADLTRVERLPEGDVAMCFEVLEHLPAPERVMALALESYERVFFSFPNPWWHNSQLNPHHVNDWPLREWKRKLSAAGAKRIKVSSQLRMRPEVLPGWRPRASSWVFDCSA